MDKRLASAAIVVLLVAAIFLYMPKKTHPIRNAPPSKPTIIAFGDSLTFGTGEGEMVPTHPNSRPV